MSANQETIYVINLEERKDRWDSLVERFAKFTFINLVRFNALKPSSSTESNNLGWKYCALSHIKLIEMAIEKKLPYLIVFEDDTMPVDDNEFECQFSLLIEFLQKNIDKWDIFNGNPSYAKLIISQLSENIIQYSYGKTANFIIYNQTCYRKILNFQETYEKVTEEFDYNSFAYDDMINHIDCKQITLLPYLTKQTQDYSNIVNKDVRYDRGIIDCGQNYFINHRALNYMKNHNNQKNIFLYWEGPDNPLILLLRKIIYAFAEKDSEIQIHLINHNNLEQYIADIPKEFYQLCYAHQADYVRVNVVCDYGGIWLDSDTIILEPFDALFDYLQKYKGFFVTESDSVCNGVFASVKKTLLMVRWKNRVNHLVRTKKQLAWTELGTTIFTNYFLQFHTSLLSDYYFFDGPNTVYPIQIGQSHRAFISNPYQEYQQIIRDYQPFLILFHTVYKNVPENLLYSKDEIPLNYFIHKAIASSNLE